MARTPKSTDRAAPAQISEVEDAVIVEDEARADAEIEPDSPVEAAAATPQPEVAAPRRSSSGGLIIAMILSGAAVAGLGFGAGILLRPSGDAALQALIDSQAGRLANLEAEVAAIPPPADLDPLQSQIEQLSAALLSQKAEIEALGAATETRLVDLEKRPSADGTLADEALAAYEREIAALRSEIAGQGSRLQEMADATAMKLDQAQEQARLIEQSSADAARNAALNAAVSQMRVALDAGGAFDAPLAEILAAGIEVAPDLAALAGEGVATISQLQNDFPAAARAALAVARSEGLAGEPESGVLSYLRSQFDVRSVVPRAGSEPDAILSRAEAALADNRLGDALSELEALPGISRAEMSAWISTATARRSAMIAVDTLAQSLNAF